SPQKIHSFPQGIQQNHLKLWIKDLEGDPGKAGASSHVDQRLCGRKIKITGGKNAVQKMLFHHVLKFCNGSEIHHPVRLDQTPVIFQKLLRLYVSEREGGLRKSLNDIFFLFFHAIFLFFAPDTPEARKYPPGKRPKSWRPGRY